jgi:hypothetical protein
VLTVSPLLMEKYIRAANTVAEKALDTSAVERIDLELGAKKFWNQKGETKDGKACAGFTATPRPRRNSPRQPPAPMC